MKIQKVIFSSSDEYLEFWEPISKFFYEKFGFESTLIYIGDKQHPSEKYGRVVRVKPLNYPMLIQILWSRLWFTKLEPNTTWMIGDIDLYPLQKTRFVDDLINIPEDYHVHLHSNRTSLPYQLWQIKGTMNGGADLSSHYHVGKGYILERNLDFHETFEEACKFIFETKRYGLGFYNDGFKGDRLYHCCCEQLSTEKIREKLLDINFIGMEYSPLLILGRQDLVTSLPNIHLENEIKKGLVLDFHTFRKHEWSIENRSDISDLYKTKEELLYKVLDLAWNK